MQANVSDEIRVGSLCYNGKSGKGIKFLSILGCGIWIELDSYDKVGRRKKRS
jgi:hypothetical protein